MKLQHFAAKHKTISFLVLAIVVCVVYTLLLMQLNAPTWLLIIVNVVLVFIIYVSVEYSPNPIIREVVKVLNEECDPYPLLEETQKLLAYKNSEVMRQMLLIDYAVGLRSIGEYQHNLDTLRTINIDKESGMLPMYKVVYYNNVMDACVKMDLYEEADVWYSKMMLIQADITNQKHQEFLAPTIQRARTVHYYCEKEFEKALASLNETPAQNKKDEVENAMMYAKIAIATGDLETAKYKLQFVIDNGNKLYVVTEAKELLDKI